MKLKHMIALILVALLVIAPLASCTVEEVPTSTIQVKFTAGDDTIFDMPVTIKGESNPVIDVVKTLIETYEANYIVLGDNDTKIQDVDIYKDCTIDGVSYYWLFYVDGQEPKQGSVSSYEVVDGQSVEFKFATMTTKDGKAISGFYDSSSNVFVESNEADADAE